MRKVSLLLVMSLWSFITCAQNSFILDVYKLEVVYNDSKLEPPNAFKVIIVEDKEKKLTIFDKDNFKYEVEFELNRNNNKVKLHRKGYLEVEEKGTFKGKNYKDVQFINDETDWTVNGVTGELLVYDKKDIETFFISYRYKIKPKKMLGFR